MYEIKKMDVDVVIDETTNIYLAVMEDCQSKGITDSEDIHVVFNNVLNTLRGESMRKQRVSGSVVNSYRSSPKVQTT